MTENSQHNAKGPMAGYLYQCRIALFQGMEMAKKKPNGSISIERFDDVAFENDNVAECLIQAKHHVNGGDLGDKSTDVWKTIRIWAQETHSDPLFPTKTKLVLLTTSTAPDGSAMEKLRAATEDTERDKACDQLVSAAKDSNNKQTKIGREAFLNLNEANRRALVFAIEVYDNAPNLIDMREEIEGQLIFTVPDHVELIADHLEGWWFSIIANSLVQDETSSIPVQHILRKIYEIAGHIQRKQLPILEEKLSDIKEYTDEDEDRVFVKQMRLIKVSNNAVHRGVSDYYRAQTQRSQWARENLLLDGESTKFDLKLVDQWGRKYEQEMDINAPSSKDAKEAVGKNLFYWAQESQIPFRNVVETWITAGSFHALADRVKLGWHPDFKDKFDVNGGEE